MLKIKQIIVLLIFLCANSVMAQQEVEHVILISIDGFRPNFYREVEWSTANLKLLAEKGISADKVHPIFPSVTYPSHTTLVTGVYPAKHGIYYNTTMDSDGKNGNWIYDFDNIKAETIWEAAKKKGLSTASVSWPISVSCPFIDYNIPEIWSMDNPIDRRGATSQYATPKGLFEEVKKYATGEMEVSDYNLTSLSMDENLSRIGAYIIKKYKPNLLTIHLPNTDGAQHKEGRLGDGVKRAIAGADHAVGNIYDALQKAKILDKSVIIITGDHGFVSTHTSIAPNLWLKDAGLFTENGDWQAIFFSAGGSAFLHLKEQNDTATLEKIKTLLNSLPENQKRMFRVVSKEELIASGADPNAALAITASKGFSFSNARDGELLNTALGGKHGYYADFDEIYTGFIAFGSQIPEGKVVNGMSLENIAPFIAHLLNIELPEKQGSLYPGLLKY